MNNKIGMVLSGGGFRGVAHLGVLQYMSERGIHPDEISGASAGALVGAFIAEGYTPEEIFRFCKKERFFSYSDLSVKNGGLFNTAIFEKIIKKYIPHDSFEGLKKPLHVSVTGLTNARSLILNRGSLSFAIKASCCFPLVFQTVLYNDDNDDVYLYDGGILNNFPVEQVRASCNLVIGINVNPVNKYNGNLTYKDIVARIIRITTSRVAEFSKTSCDMYLQPDELHKYSTFDTTKTDELFGLGYEYAGKFEKEFLILKENHQRQ